MTLVRTILAFLLVGFAHATPNVIVIYTDDHGWPDIGAADIYEDLKTPHIDALAADGVRCTNGYSTAPQCVPSRGGLLAGRDQSRFGLETNGESLDGFDAEETIAERLQKADYLTAQLGKWHLGPSSEIIDHGFDRVFSKNSERPSWTNFAEEFDDLYHLDACTEAARKFITEVKDQPFFLYLAYRAPHVPLDAPRKYLDRFPGKMPERRRQALAMISAMDDGVGAIRDSLREHGLEEDTLIFLIGDNGAPLKIHKIDAPGGGPGWDGSLNAPMNGEKGMLAEGGIRVPFIVAWPKTIPAGQVYDHSVSTLDVAATASSIAGLPLPARYDGINLIPYLSGERADPPHEVLFWRWSSQSAIREGQWKFLRGGRRDYLFDLENDPGETRNLAAEQPKITDRLRIRLGEWTQELRPPGFIGQVMPQTWETYFDHYLDGKTVTREAHEKITASQTHQGWIVRNGLARIESDRLLVSSRKDEGRLETIKPFLAHGGLSIQGGPKVRVRVKSEEPGPIGVSWRLAGQKDFVSGASVIETLEPSDDPVLREFSLPDEEVIHLRIHLPAGRVWIDSIRLSNDSQMWNFRTP